MKKNILTVLMLFLTSVAIAQVDSVVIEEVSVVSFYRNNIDNSGLIDEEELVSQYGQDPSHMFTSMPSIISQADNGTDFGYGYFRIRGLDQTRINVTLDGCPWNEAEDFGSYFANSPDLISSMKSIKVERGGNSSNNGVAGSAGGINLESINVFDKHRSYANLGVGSFNTYRVSGVYNMTPTEKWGLHAKITHQKTDGYRENSENSSQAVTVKFGYRINKNHTIDFLTMNGFHRNGQGWIGCTMDELLFNKNANGCTEYEDDNWFMSMNRLQYKGRVSDYVILTSSLYAQIQDGSYRFDLDNYNNKFFAQNSNTNTIYDYHLTHYMVGGNVFARFYLQSFVLTTGINAYTYKRNHFMGDKGVNVPLNEMYSNYGIKNDISGLIGLTYNYNDKLTVGGNIQVRNPQFRYNDTDKYGNPLGKMYSFDKWWGFLNYGVSAEYSPTKSFSIYGKYNHLNREPTRSDMFGGNEYYTGDIVTNTPEISDDVEFGVDINVQDAFHLNLNAYYMLFKNELVLNGKYGPNGLPCHENAKESYRRGIEMTMNWNIVGNLNYTLNGSLSQNKIKSDAFGVKNHILTPSANGFSEISWLGDIFDIGLSYTFRTKMYIDMENKYELPYSDSLDLWFKLKFDKCEFFVVANGLIISDDLDFCSGMVTESGDLLYIQNNPFDMMCQFKYYF